MINAIFKSGEDALNNEAIITIDINNLLPGLRDMIDSESLSFRAVDYSIPQKGVRTYEQSYKGFSIERWKAGVDITREVSITFRVDKYWKVYKFLKAWIELIASDNGGYTPDVSSNSVLRTSISIQSIIAQTQSTGESKEVNTSPEWSFVGAYPKSIPEISFDQTAEGDPIQISVPFGFLDYQSVEAN